MPAAPNQNRNAAKDPAQRRDRILRVPVTADELRWIRIAAEDDPSVAHYVRCRILPKR